MERLFGIEDLTKSASAASEEFRAQLPGLAEWYPQAIDVLLKLPYSVGPIQDRESDRGNFELFALSQYEQVPYTFWVIYDLARQGYYFEAIILLRNPLEIFTQLRYFDLHVDQFLRHLHGARRGDRVQFKVMFDAFAPGFYERYYGELYSRYAHGKGGHFALRYQRKEGGISPILGNQYDPEKLTFVMNAVLPLLLGFLRLFSRFVPSNTLAAEPSTSEKIANLERWVEGHIVAHKEAYPQTHEWYALLEPLIRS
jgi:hypothetical protein